MSIYPNKTEPDLTNLTKIAGQEKNQRAKRLKNETFKQIHDKNLALFLKLIAEKLT